MRVNFGDWMPDLPRVMNQQGLATARNMFPQLGGYASMRGLAALTAATVLPSSPRGAISSIDARGVGFMYAGVGSTTPRLYTLDDAGMTDVSNASGYELGAAERWSFEKFGKYVFAANINAPMQYHEIGSPAKFADVPAFAPRARHLATIGDFLMAGNIYDPIAGSQPEWVSWSAIQQPLLWPTIGSDSAVQVQADRQPIEGFGWIQDIVAAAEVGVVFSEKAITRFDYRGGSAIFERNTIESGNGMLIPGSGAAFERSVFFVAEDGFRVLDLGAGSRPVGKDRVSDTFLADVDQQYLDNVETAKDPDRTVIWIIYPGSGNTSGRPNKGILWDYALDRFSHFELELEGLIGNATTGTASIDAPASAGDPDDVDDPSGEESFDDRAQVFGNSRMGAFDTTFLASDFSGSLLEGLLETGDLQLTPGSRTFVNSVRPIVDGRNAEVALAELNLRGDDVYFGDYVGMDDDGTVPFRSDGRFHRFKVKLPPGWDDAVYLDVDGIPAGGR